MYAVVSTWYGISDEIETWEPRFRETVDRVCVGPGFLGAELLIDRTAGKAMARCLWESETAAGAHACTEVFGRDAFAGGSEPTVERYEVVVSGYGVRTPA